ncbi:Uncharacterised protein [Mycobacteroides abscessus subsp. abscessus]|nr:Uncharacterised protein [Mycobacteroides abscessus subsp. abscessus]
MVGQLEGHADAFVIARTPGHGILAPHRYLAAVAA